MLFGRLDTGMAQQLAYLFHRDACRQPTARGSIPQTMRSEVRVLPESRPEECAEIVLPVCHG